SSVPLSSVIVDRTLTESPSNFSRDSGCLNSVVPLLLADHQNRKRTWHRCALRSAAPARGWRRRRSTLLAHRQDVIRLAVERDRSGAIHRLKILLDLETC